MWSLRIVDPGYSEKWTWVQDKEGWSAAWNSGSVWLLWAKPYHLLAFSALSPSHWYVQSFLLFNSHVEN